METYEITTIYNYVYSLSLDNRRDIPIDEDDKTIILTICNIYLSDEQISDDYIRFALDTGFITLQDVYTLLNYFGKTQNINKIQKELYSNLYKIFFKKAKEIYLKNNPSAFVVERKPVVAESKPVVAESKPVVAESKPVVENKQSINIKPFSEYTREEINRLREVNPMRSYDSILREINQAIDDNNLNVLLEPVYFREGTSSFIKKNRYFTAS